MRDKKGEMTRRKEGREDLGKRERKERERKIQRGKGHSQGPGHPLWTWRSWHPVSQTLGRDLWESATVEGTREIKLPPGLPLTPHAAGGTAAVPAANRASQADSLQARQEELSFQQCFPGTGGKSQGSGREKACELWKAKAKGGCGWRKGAGTAMGWRWGYSPSNLFPH